MIDMEKLLSGAIPESLAEKTEAAGAISGSRAGSCR